MHVTLESIKVQKDLFVALLMIYQKSRDKSSPPVSLIWLYDT